MEFEKEMTAPVVSVGADTEQSSQTFTDNSLTDFDSDFKVSDDDFYREMQRRMAPDYLETVSMTALYDTDFEEQEPLIDGRWSAVPRRLLTGRLPEGGKELPDGPACLSYQHRHTTVELSCPQRHGAVPCSASGSANSSLTHWWSRQKQ